MHWLDLPESVFTVFTALEAVWVVLSSIYIILERRSPQATLAWILTFAILPILGFLIYLILGPRRFDRRKRRRRRARKVVKNETTSPEVCAVPSAPAINTPIVTLVESCVGEAGLLRFGDVQVLFGGEAKFAALEEALREAQEQILMEYYIWETDRIGTRIRDLLAERARAGVAVRVLVDSLGSSRARRKFWAPLRAAGAEVRLFNGGTLTTWRPSMTNFRTHRKIAVIDDRVGFTGGMNLTDAHSAEFVQDKAWRDTHLRIVGEAVEGLARVFYEDWQYAGGDVRALMQGGRKLPVVASRGHLGVPLQIVSSGPDENVDSIHKLFFTTMADASKRIQLTTPYFVPDEPILQALAVAAMRGVDVDLILPESGDQPIVAAAARSYYPELLAAGVRIHEMAHPVLHAKTLVVDDVAIVGTANMDNRSFRLNFEVVAVMYDERVAKTLADAFAEDLARSVQLTEESVQNASLKVRLQVSSARLFSPIL